MHSHRTEFPGSKKTCSLACILLVKWTGPSVAGRGKLGQPPQAPPSRGSRGAGWRAHGYRIGSLSHLPTQWVGRLFACSSQKFCPAPLPPRPACQGFHSSVCARCGKGSPAQGALPWAPHPAEIVAVNGYYLYTG